MVAIVGGGICGLAIGWRLAQAGHAVTIYDRREVAREATWASSGYLIATSGDDPFARLIQEGCAKWPDFAAELSAASGQDLDYRREGSIAIAEATNAAELRAACAFEQRLGWPVEWLDAKALRAAEPSLSQNLVGGLFDPQTHWVDNRAVGDALAVAVERAGGNIEPHCPVERILVEGDRVVGLQTSDRRIAADTVLLAAGAWTGRIGGVPPAAQIVTIPIKGEMLAVQMPPDAPLHHLIKRPSGGALVPRSSGRLVIGTTVENVGFDQQVVVRTVLELLQDAAHAVPVILDLPLLEVWAGLRPFTPDGEPVLGSTVVPGLWVATGLGAHGIMTAPAVADGVAKAVMGEPVPDYVAGLAPGQRGG